MKTAIVTAACLLAGCANMTPTEKKVAWIAAGVVVTSVAISASNNDGPAPPPCPSFHWEFTTDTGVWTCVN